MRTRSLLHIALLCGSGASTPFQPAPQGSTTLQKHTGMPSCLDGEVILSNSSIVGKRAVDSTCSGHQDIISRAYADCASRARAGERVARRGPDPLMSAIFKDDGETARQHVADQLGQIAEECEKNGQGTTTVSCGACVQGVAGLTVITIGGPRGRNPVTLCDVALRPTPEESCSRQDLGDVLLHELSHSWGVTEDKGYGIQNVLGLSAEDSLQNADSYSLFAKGASLNCTVEDFAPGAKKKPRPSGSHPGSGSGDGSHTGSSQSEKPSSSQSGKPEPGPGQSGKPEPGPGQSEKPGSGIPSSSSCRHRHRKPVVPTRPPPSARPFPTQGANNTTNRGPTGTLYPVPGVRSTARGSPCPHAHPHAHTKSGSGLPSPSPSNDNDSNYYPARQTGEAQIPAQAYV